MCEPKVPYSRYTQNPATATTTTTTSSIHPRVSRRPIEILLTRKPFANRKMVRLERSSLLRFEREPTATTGTVRDRTGRAKRFRMGGGRSVRALRAHRQRERDSQQPRPGDRSQNRWRTPMPLPAGLQNSHQKGRTAFSHLRGRTLQPNGRAQMAPVKG